MTDIMYGLSDVDHFQDSKLTLFYIWKVLCKKSEYYYNYYFQIL